MATIITRAGKGSALTFAEMDANFTNLNDELANVSLGVLPANSVSATELDNSDDYTVSTLTTTGNVIVGDSLIPSSGNLEINTDYLVVSDASGTEKFKIRTDVAPGADQILKYNETTGFVQWANDAAQSGSAGSQSGTNFVLASASDLDLNNNKIINSESVGSIGITLQNDEIRVGETTAKITTATAIDLVLDTNLGTNSGTFTITDGANGNMTLAPNGTGDVVLGNFTFDVDQAVGAGQDNYVLTYDNASGKISLEAATGGGGVSDIVDDTTPQLGGDLDVNGNEIITSATGEIRLGDGADRYATVDMNADKLRLSNISLDLADNLIVTTTTDGDIKLRPDGTGGVRIGRSNTDVELKTNGGALTIKTNANDADITIEPHGSGVVNMKKYKVESPSFGDMPVFSRTSTNTGATSFSVRQNYSTTARAAGQTAGAMNFTNVNDVDSLETFFIGLVQGEVGDSGTYGSAGENNNAILLKTFVDNSTFGQNLVGEFRYASAGIMNGNLTFDDTSGVITIEAATTDDDLTLKTSGTGDITMDPSGTGYIILNNLPTSSAGLPTGAVWNDSGTLKIA